MDTACGPEDLPEAMNDWEKWRERFRDIGACDEDDDVKIHLQRDKLEVVYQIGERSCSELCYSRGEKKNSLYIFICVDDYN